MQKLGNLDLVTRVGLLGVDDSWAIERDIHLL